MWNCSAVITRNGSLCNSNGGLTKNSHLQKYVVTTLGKRLFKTFPVAIKEQTDVKKFGKCITNCMPIVNSSNQTYRYSNATHASINNLSIRTFHSSFITKYSEDAIDPKQSKLNNERKVNIDYSSLLNNNDAESDPFTHIPEEKHTSHTEKSSEHSHMKTHDVSLKHVERLYPNPKDKVHQIVQLVNINTKQQMKINYSYSRIKDKTHKMQCTLNVFWPEAKSFTAKGNNKVTCGNIVAWKYLNWLESIKKLKRGLPVVYSSSDLQNLQRPVTLSVKAETLNDAKVLLDKYEENIQSIIDSNDYTLNMIHNFQEGAIIDPVGKSNPASRSQTRINTRNETLQLRFEHRKSKGDFVDLPINQFRERIIKEIKENNVVVIKGDTGCGKTTQVPQFIMDDFAARGRATDCNMIVSQPRRISAISLAERIASERSEQVGDIVGYQVRLAQELPNTPAGILFCTSGILLRKLQFNPTLDGCTHVIIDEAHERTINIDMLLVLLKRAMQQRPSLKIIIMSATINAELFQSYFNCNVINIPGRTFPVKMHFLEDIDALNLRSANKWDASFDEMENNGPTTDIVKMGELISWITQKKPPGAILCFLPGWSEIVKMKKYLEEYSFMSKSQTLIVPVHSRMSHYDQRKIFSVTPPDVRKIVLATDIAETGITVTDVVYVVDSCTHRQVQWHEKRGFASIDNHWASQANINQRKGRAGRVRPGESYHFITREKFQQLDDHPAPEVMRSSLEKTVLDAKTYSQEKAVDFLGSMPQPPALSTIRKAVQDLIHLGALDNEENLTPLGKRIALFTLNPQLSKAIVYSSIFQCVSPLITIASVMSGETEIFAGTLYDKNKIRNIKSQYHPTSDHISIAWLFQQWYSLENQNRYKSRDFAFKSNLVPEKVFTLSKVRGIHAEHLYHSKMLPSLDDLDNMSAKENEYAELDELCRGVLLAGLDQLLYQRDFDIRKAQLKMGAHTFIMEDGNRATITPDSVNFKRKSWPSPFITYVRRTHNEERRTSLIRETSIISPLTVFLFSQARIFGYAQKNDENTKETNNNNVEKSQIIFSMQNRKNVKLICDKETADVLLNFRDAMWSVVRYLVANQGVENTNNEEELEQVETFKTHMLQVLVKMLSEASKSVDNPDSSNKNKIEDESDDEDDY
ncbi:hypothetical protein PV327_006700 [Microctonus hyperodae]|uniref:ATP-dependent RNA helicase DHX30 n=1 Tax=Microctonus hyperodae TaxID=165561 RepID=A0AA39F4Z2_MICHY|nr:hypothetical protein PV327_006700 [Microctonus hyperodae]